MIQKDKYNNVSIKYEKTTSLNIDQIAAESLDDIMNIIDVNIQHEVGTEEWEDEIEDSLSTEEINQIYELILLEVIREMEEL